MEKRYYTKEEFMKFASIAVDALEAALSRTIWRTLSRVHELVVLDNPGIDKNPFIFDKFRFTDLLMRFSFSGSVSMILRSDLAMIGEIYQEGPHEDTIYADLKLHGEMNTGVAFMERMYYEGYTLGLNKDESLDRLKGLEQIDIERMKTRLKCVGLRAGNIFYKYPTGQKTTDSPSGPRTVEYLS